MKESTPSAWHSLLADLGPTEHAVQLYQDDDFFGHAVSHFTAHGLLKNEAIIIVATKPHWENIAGRLTNKGFDIEELRRAGQLTLLDADETLPKFLVKDMPDGRTFKGIAHDTIGKARANGRYANVRWWGEMVNVLYVKGNGQASTRLEEFFDEVAHQESIAIFCSFLMDKFDRQVYDGPLQNVCRTHAHLIPSEDYSRHKECVDRALLEVFRGMESQLLHWLGSSKRWSGPEMPASQALLLWLIESKPDIAGRVLALARHWENTSRSLRDRPS